MSSSFILVCAYMWHYRNTGPVLQERSFSLLKTAPSKFLVKTIIQVRNFWNKTTTSTSFPCLHVYNRYLNEGFDLRPVWHSCNYSVSFLASQPQNLLERVWMASAIEPVGAKCKLKIRIERNLSFSFSFNVLWAILIICQDAQRLPFIANKK